MRYHLISRGRNILWLNVTPLEDAINFRRPLLRNVKDILREAMFASHDLGDVVDIMRRIHEKTIHEKTTLDIRLYAADTDGRHLPDVLSFLQEFRILNSVAHPEAITIKVRENGEKCEGCGH